MSIAVDAAQTAIQPAELVGQQHPNEDDSTQMQMQTDEPNNEDHTDQDQHEDEEGEMDQSQESTDQTVPAGSDSTTANSAGGGGGSSNSSRKRPRKKAPLGPLKRPKGNKLPPGTLTGTAQTAATHAAASSHDATNPDQLPAKRGKRAPHPSNVSSNEEGVDTETNPRTNELTPALLSILGDLEWMPRFMQTVLTHLTQSRNITPNWHVVSALWRQRLVEGGWLKDTHFVIKVDKHGRYHLTRSRRIVSDFTPPVCERLFTILFTRDRSPEAAAELQAAMEEHRRLEAAAESLPFFTNGHPAPRPPTETFKLEFTGGLPRGCTATILPGEYERAHGVTLEEAQEDEVFDVWPGLSQDGANRMDGATIRRWARGHEVHVSTVPPTAPSKPNASSATSSSTTTSPHVPISVRANLISAVTDLSNFQRRSLSNHNEVASIKQYLRSGLMLDLSTGEWANIRPTEQQMVSQMQANFQVGGVSIQPNQVAYPVLMDHHVRNPPPTWVSPRDDLNLLDSVIAWLSSQPLPTPDTFRSLTAADLETNGVVAALLPRTLDAWVVVRRLCAGYVFPLTFYRRRWWLLCQIAHEIQAAEDPASIIKTNPAVEPIMAKVTQITTEITQRMKVYTEKYGELSALHTPSPPCESSVDVVGAVVADASGAMGKQAEAEEKEEKTQLEATATSATPSIKQEAKTNETTAEEPMEVETSIWAQAAAVATNPEPNLPIATQ